jgi:hypothetical protein
MLELRSIVITRSQYERVVSCTDLDTLDSWIDRSLHVTTAEQVFAEHGR